MLKEMVNKNMVRSSIQSNEKNIDIIIVNYNSTEYLIKCSESIYATSNGFVPNLIVVDNGSKDEPERFKFKFPQAQFIKNEKNEGFSKAVNIALSKCSAPLVMLLNPDTIVVDGFFEDMIDFMNENLDVAIAGPKVLDEDGTIQGSARSFPTILTSIFGRKSPLTILFPNNSITRENILTGKSDGINPYPVDWVSGACMILRRDALARIGTFDEHFFMYWEDADICRRAKDAGYQVVYYPKPEVYHLVGKSSDTKPLFSILHFHRSCYCLFKKYSTWPGFLTTLVSIMGLAFRCAIVILINRLDRLIQAKRKKTKRLGKVDKQYQTKKKKLRVTSRQNKSSPSIIAANIDDDDLLIGIIGRFSSRNNHRMFLESASYLYKQNPDLKAKFVVVGGGELKEELEANVSRLGLSDQVIFTGWEKDLHSLYTDLDILALTSANEGAPASIIEAMAAKVSVITTSGGGIKDLLGESDQEDTHKNGFNVCKRGILCPNNDPVVFAEGLEHLINNRSIDRNAKRTQKNP